MMHQRHRPHDRREGLQDSLGHRHAGAIRTEEVGVRLDAPRVESIQSLLDVAIADPPTRSRHYQPVQQIMGRALVRVEKKPLPVWMVLSPNYLLNEARDVSVPLRQRSPSADAIMTATREPWRQRHRNP
jgi:hypothetical protein